MDEPAGVATQRSAPLPAIGATPPAGSLRYTQLSADSLRERLEVACRQLESCRDDFERIAVRDQARAAAAAAKVLERRDVQVVAAELVQRAERAIACANPAIPPEESGRAGRAKQLGASPWGDAPTAVLDRRLLSKIRKTHESLSDEDFEQRLADARVTQEPITRKALQASPAHKPASRRNPATYTDGVVEMMAELVCAHLSRAGTVRILDPMAGEGHIAPIVGLLGDHVVTLEMSDLDRWLYARPEVKIADAAALPHPDACFDVVATSPPYGNRMADTLSTDGDQRVIYADRLGREPGAGSAASLQWGPEYRRVMAAVWAEQMRVVRPGGLVIANLKDHIRDKQWADVAGWHIGTLQDLGAAVVAMRGIFAEGVQGLANDDSRTDVEHVVAMRVPPAT